MRAAVHLERRKAICYALSTFLKFFFYQNTTSRVEVAWEKKGQENYARDVIVEFVSMQCIEHIKRLLDKR